MMASVRVRLHRPLFRITVAVNKPRVESPTELEMWFQLRPYVAHSAVLPATQIAVDDQLEGDASRRGVWRQIVRSS